MCWKSWNCTKHSTGSFNFPCDFFKIITIEACDFWIVLFMIFTFLFWRIHPKSIMHLQMMTSYVWVQTADGSVQQVEQAIAMFCPFICHEIHIGKGTSKNHSICLPEKVNPATLSLILDYCRFHQEAGHSNKVLLSFPLYFLICFYQYFYLRIFFWNVIEYEVARACNWYSVWPFCYHWPICSP